MRLVEETIADTDVAPGSSESFVQLAIYNLFGAADLPRHFSQGEKLFVRICRIIKRDLSDPNVGPADIAAEIGISVRYLQKIFAMRGTTYGSFPKSFRLNHAAGLLNRRTEMQTKLPLVEVARACGYRDYAYFARDFRSRFGHTPGSFNACE
jgi:AraC-like DNA-binding protein